jgi:hypothetical protein
MEMIPNIVETLRGAEEVISAIHKAFGAPGDYGYETKEGKALFALYRFQASVLSAAIQEASAPTGETERLTRLRDRYGDLTDRIAKLRDRYLDQSKFADVEPSSYFRSFIRDLDILLNGITAPNEAFSSESSERGVRAQLRAAISDRDKEITDLISLLSEAWSALNFILAFYEPGQRYLDTEAWKQAESYGRAVHANLRKIIDQGAKRIIRGEK